MAARITIRVPSDRATLLAMLDALVRVNSIMMRRRRFPALYRSGVRYAKETRDPRTGQRREDWLTIPDVLRRKRGDCEDLTAYRVAELRAQGVNARPWIYRSRPNMWHVVVKLPDGTIEDPSARLGMKKPTA